MRPRGDGRGFSEMEQTRTVASEGVRADTQTQAIEALRQADSTRRLAHAHSRALLAATRYERRQLARAA